MTKRNSGDKPPESKANMRFGDLLRGKILIRPLTPAEAAARREARRRQKETQEERAPRGPDDAQQADRDPNR
ncbi:MAG: hypothetical protein Kow0062_19590 [Acidobacteriota bacterium]